MSIYLVLILLINVSISQEADDEVTISVRPRLVTLSVEDIISIDKQREHARQLARGGSIGMAARSVLLSFKMILANDPESQKIHISRPDSTRGFMLGVHYESPDWLGKDLDKFIIQIQSAGLFEWWARETLERANVTLQDNGSGKDNASTYRSIHLQWTISIFFIWACGMGLGAVSFLVRFLK